MKKIVLAFFFAAIPFIFACTKSELAQPKSDIKLVQRTFSATLEVEPAVAPSSKGELGTDGKTMQWTAGDAIAVYDDVNPDIAHKFTAQSSGPSTTFTGSVSDGATSFYAVYPYDACMKHDAGNERFTVTIPRLQYAVEDSFDPRSVIAGACLTDDGGDASGFNFKLVPGLLKFSVDYDDVLSVTFSNTARNMSGNFTFDIQSAQSGKIANVGEGNLASEYVADRWKDVIIRNEDGSPLKKGSVYYVVCKQSSTTNPYTSVSVSLMSQGPKSATKSYTSSLVVARKAIRNFGEFSGLSFAPVNDDRYTKFLAGLDLEIAGRIYNIGGWNAELVSAGATDAVQLNSSLGKTDKRIIFLESEGANFTTSASNVNGKGNIVVVANTDRVTFVPASIYNLGNGCLVMKDIDIDASTMGTAGKNLISNGSFQATPSLLAFDNCYFSGLSKQIFATVSGAVNHGIKEVYFDGCKVGTKTAVGGLINIGKTTESVSEWEKFTVKNCVFYSETGDGFDTRILNCAQTYEGVHSVTNLEVDFSNTILYKIGNSGGFFAFPAFKKITISGILQYVTNGWSLGANSKLFKSNSAQHTNSGISNFGVYGTLGGDYSVTVCDSADRIGGITNAVTTLETYPFVSQTPVTDGFALIDAYKSLYGPQ